MGMGAMARHRAPDVIDTSANHPALAIPEYADAVRARARGEADLAWAIEERGFAQRHITPIDHACRGLARLRHGCHDGWLSYEWRWADPRHRAHHARPFMQTHEPWHRFACDANGHWVERPGWEAELKTLTILVGQEGGAGDMIMLSRFLPWLAQRAKLVYWLVPLDMLRLAQHFTRDSSRIKAIAQEDLPRFDRYVMMFSLPAIVGEMLPPDDVTHKTSLVKPAGGLDMLTAGLHNAAEFEKVNGKATGLCWAGSPLYANNLPLYGNTDIRSMDQSAAREFGLALADAVPPPRISYQRGERRFDLSAACRGGIVTDEHVTGDWFDTYTSLARECTRVVTVDTGLAHLAGAMGIPTYTLLALDHCWRWGGDQSRTSWYPSMRLIAQQTPGDWSYPIEEVVRHLKAERS